MLELLIYSTPFIMVVYFVLILLYRASNGPIALSTWGILFLVSVFPGVNVVVLGIVLLLYMSHIISSSNL